MRNKLVFLSMLLAALAVLMIAAVVVSSDRRGRDVIGYNVLKEFSSLEIATAVSRTGSCPRSSEDDQEEDEENQSHAGDPKK